MIDIGTGPPIVVIPGIQGRWEWMRPAIDALGRRCRVIACSLCGEPGSGCRMDRTTRSGSFMRQLDDLLARAGLDRAALCGVSFGGLIALHYAAERPERVTRLVVVSTPAPGWRPPEHIAQYARAPILSAPAFVFGSFGRLAPEIACALPSRSARLAFWIQHLVRVALAPASPTRMSERLSLWNGADFAIDCTRITQPTLVVTGEVGLDRVVPVEVTRRYVTAIRGAREATIERTGHIGLVTRPERFAELVAGFVHEGDLSL